MDLKSQALEAIANMKIDADTNHEHLTALMITIAKSTLEHEGFVLCPACDRWFDEVNQAGHAAFEFALAAANR